MCLGCGAGKGCKGRWWHGQERKSSEAIAMRRAKRDESPPARPRIMAAMRPEILVFLYFTTTFDHFRLI